MNTETAIKKVKFSKTTTSIGRNGVVKTQGVEVMRSTVYSDENNPFPTIILSPVTSRNTVANCSITIPDSDIYNTLKAIVDMMPGETESEPFFDKRQFAMSILNELGFGCVCLWHTDDIIDNTEEWGYEPGSITEEDAAEILEIADNAHDAGIGINWEVLRSHTWDYMQGKKSEEKSITNSKTYNDENH